MPTDRVMAYLRSVPKPLKKNKKIIENLLTNFQKRAIIRAQRGKAEAEAKCKSKRTGKTFVAKSSLLSTARGPDVRYINVN